MNLVVLCGNLGAEPEVFTTKSDKQKLTLRLATSEKWRDQSGNRKEKTSWHTVVYWADSAAQLASMLHRGSKVLVQGKLEYRAWETKEGEKREKAEVVARNIQLVEPKRDNAAREAFPDPEPLPGGLGHDGVPDFGPEPGLGDDVPF